MKLCLVNKALLFPGDSDTSRHQDHTPGIIVLQDSAQQAGCPPFPARPHTRGSRQPQVLGSLRRVTERRERAAN